MIYPTRMLILMALTLAAVAAGCAFAFKPLAAAFASSLAFHGAMAALLAIGIAVQFAQAGALVPATRWIDRTRRGFAAKEPPRVLAPVAAVLAGREREGFTLSLLAVRSLVEATRSHVRRIDVSLARLADEMARPGQGIRPSRAA